MAVNGIELAAGQTWRNQDGFVVHLTLNEHGPFIVSHPFRCFSVDRVEADYSINRNGMTNTGNNPTPSRYDLKEIIYDEPSFADSHEALTFHPLESTAPGQAVNPKDAIGSTKLPLHLWPAEATAMGCLGMLDGAGKYGRNNMIAGEGVVASIYIAAAKRHLDAWFSGEDCAPDTKAPHLANALATIAIIVKCQAHGKLIDDRDYAPNPGYRKLVEELTPLVKHLTDLHAGKNPRHFTIADNPPPANVDA